MPAAAATSSELDAVHADETVQRVLDKEHCLKGWMWVMLSQQAIAYQYRDHRDAATARDLLGNTTGNLTIDGTVRTTVSVRRMQSANAVDVGDMRDASCSRRFPKARRSTRTARSAR